MTLDRAIDKANWVGCNQGAGCCAEYVAAGGFDAENWQTADAPWTDGDVALICRECDMDS